jgi:putative transposase
MPNYRRAFVTGGTFFFTLVTHCRRPFLTTLDARKILKSAIATELRTHPFELVATVLLPDHLHAIWALPSGDSRYSSRWWRIKRRFTMDFLSSGGAETNRSNRKMTKGERGVWQSRFWEHTIKDDDDFKRCLDYIHWNPVKHGYVVRPCDYPWSTFQKVCPTG